MQNTARVQNHANTLIKNFFIAGLDQSNIGNRDHKKLSNMFNQEPEVLFSLYQSAEEVSMFLKFVFPDKIEIKQDESDVVPKFFTFMSTDAEGQVAFFHCLTYYEKYTLNDIWNDYDESNEKVRISIQAKLEKLRSESVTEPESQEYKVEDWKNNRAGGVTPIYTAATIGAKHSDDSKIHMRSKKKDLWTEKKKGQDSMQRSTQYSLGSLRNKLMEESNTMDKIHEEDEGQDELYSRTRSDARSQFVQKRDRVESDPNKPQECESSGTEGDQVQDNQKFQINTTGGTDPYFVPFAFVISTEIENHDIFREILVQLFESIRIPQNLAEENLIKNSTLDKQRIAFADFLAHIAFLKTIPCPSFNTKYNIEFFSKTLIMEEQQFFAIPNRNQIAIKVLFDTLDVRSILYMWKAMLFDASIILISQCNNLQFYVAEALKQLIFPLTWQHSYIQPAGKPLRDYVESPSPVIFCCNPLDTDFEYFDKLQKSGFNNLAIIDIDGSYTNDLQFPQLCQEQQQLKALNIAKNSKIAKYDYAYKEMVETELQDENSISKRELEFVVTIRKKFFDFLRPLLLPIKDCIRDKYKKENRGRTPKEEESKKLDDENIVFGNYFDMKLYMAPFEEENQAFAKRFADSSQFQCFCDDYFLEHEITNYRMFFSIVEEAELSEDDKRQRQQEYLKDKLGKNQQQAEDIINQKDKAQAVGEVIGAKGENIQNYWKQLVVDWRMPQDSQRVMLFEKLQFFSEIKKPKNDSDLDTKKWHEDNETLLKNIKDLYSRKLPLLKQQKINAFNKGTKEDKNKGQKDETPLRLKKAVSFKEKDLDTKTTNQSEQGIEDERGGSSVSDSKNSASEDFRNTSIPSLTAQETPEHLRLTDKSPMIKSQQSVLGSSSKSYTTHKQEDHTINTCYKKIQKLNFGKNGFLAFLDKIFLQITELDLRQQFNYYFALKRHLEVQQAFKSEKKAEMYHNKEEDFNDDVNLPFKKSANSMFKKQRKTKFLDNPTNECDVTNKRLTKFSVVNPEIWMMPQMFSTEYERIRNSFQYMLIRTKLFLMFENNEDALGLTFRELVNFPQSTKQYFPYLRFNQLLSRLTIEQKEDEVQKMNKEGLSQNSFQLDFLKKNIKINKASLDDSGYKIVFGLDCEEHLKKLKESLMPTDMMMKKTTSAPPLTKRKSSLLSPNPVKNKLLNSPSDKKQSFSGFLGLSKPQSQTQQHDSTTKTDSLLCTILGGSVTSSTTQQSNSNLLNDSSLTKNPSQTVMVNGIDKSHDLLNLIINFWRENIDKADPKKFTFPEKEVIPLLEKLVKIKMKAQELKNVDFYFATFDTENEEVPNSTTHGDDKDMKKWKELIGNVGNSNSSTKDSTAVQCGKQAFWLNILNFMTLFRFAEIFLIQPKLVKELTSYAMWQSFQVNNFFYIKGAKISQYDIYHSFVRQSKKLPRFSRFMHKKRAIDENMKDLICSETSKLFPFGIYYPCAKFPTLSIYTVTPTIDICKQIRMNLAQSECQTSMWAESGSFLIRLPRFIYWYMRDFNNNELEDLESTLKFLVQEQMTPTAKLDQQIRLVIDEMTQSRGQDGSGSTRRQDGSSKLPHQFEFDHVNWKFNFDTFKKSIKDAKMHDQWSPQDWQKISEIH